MAQPPPGTILLSSGSICSTDPVFCNKNGGKQDVLICAVALASAFMQREFNQAEIDNCIHTGDLLYTTLGFQNEEAAAPAQLPSQITLNNPAITVQITENTHLTSYLYQENDQDLQNAKLFLIDKLTHIFDTSPPKSGFLFGSSRGFVAFYNTDEGFKVFEPQGVGGCGLFDEDFTENNTSRFFYCESLYALTDFLLIHPLTKNTFPEMFTVVRMRFHLPLEQQRLHEERLHSELPSGSSSETPLPTQVPENETKHVTVGSDSDSSTDTPLAKRHSRAPCTTPAQEGSDSDTPLARRVAAKVKKHKTNRKLDSESENSDTPLASRLTGTRKQSEKSSTDANTSNTALASRLLGQSNPAEATTSPGVPSPKRGRPKKVKRGRPKKVISGEEQAAEKETRRVTKRKYAENNPEVHRDAQQRYRQNNPEVHRDEQQRYCENNPEDRRDTQQRYQDRNPEIHRAAQERHVQNHPEERAEQRERYQATHPQRDKIRHLTNDMQNLVRDHGPMGFWSGDLLANVQPHRLKKPNLHGDDIFSCRSCGARLFEEEPHTGLWCCGNNKYNVLNLPPLDADFYTHKDFLQRPRAYNDLMSLCAMNISGGYRHLPGLSFLKIEGRIYHKIYSLNSRGQHTNFDRVSQYVNHCKLYIDDGSERRALAEGRKLNPIIIDQARSHLLANNPFLLQFRLLSEEAAEDARLEFQVTTRATHGPVLGDRNPGTEVHAVISTGDRLANAPRNLTVWKRADQYPTVMSIFDPLMECFQYPLLYPQGTPGWHINKSNNIGGKLTQLQYVRCLLLSEPRFTQLGRLSQCWQVEMFARMEEERLQYIARCQKQNNLNALRVATVDELQASVDLPQQVIRNINNDVMAELAQDEMVQGDTAPQAGKIYLPSTFTGGPRYMKTKYMNAMGLVARKGGPTYFLTFTACGQWDELRQSTRHGNQCDPATCCRIFHIKLNELLRDIRSGALFGPQAYILYVIEFQMRGLPHAHLAIRTEDGGPVQARDINTVIRADIPDEQEANGRLRALVLKHMVHGPCGPGGRTNLPCWDEATQKCNKYFPKPHTETTHIDDRGFVHYRRDHNKKSNTFYRNRPVEIHEGWIIPYNAALLLKYEAHINLEIASTRRVVKYLFKYLCKGTSHQNVRILPLHEQLDEPEEYATKRMIGASDACWRMLGYKLTVSEPTVDMLPVHLEGQQSVVFRPGQEGDAIGKSSKLMLYMNRPADNIFDQITYQNFYENYIVHPTRQQSKPGKPVYAHPDGKHYITARQRGECVTRMYWVSPNRGELYYLRTLLASLPCRGFADLMAKGGHDCQSFQETARRLGLTENEREYEETLQEASHFMLGPQLRNFFVVLANIGAPARLLWDAFKEKLCEDLIEKYTDKEIAFKWGLIHIDRSLRRNGSSNICHGLPQVEDHTTELGRQFLTFSEESQKQIYDESYPKLTNEQLTVFNHVKNLVDGSVPDGQESAIFLDGPAGNGKTFLLGTITAYLRSRKKIPICVASSGIAALNLEGGTTAHAMFRLPLDLGDGVGTWNISNGTQRAELLRAASLIIFDEAPMGHKHIFEMLDRSLKDLMGNEKLFGGIPFLASGDYRQIPPVAEKARTPSDTIAVSLKSSYLWDKFQVFRLTIPQRTRGSDDYSKYLLEVGNGTLPEKTFGEGRDAENLVPLTPIAHKTDLNDLINHIYPHDLLARPDNAAERAILSTLNVNVRTINDKILSSIPNRLYQLRSFDAVDKDGDDGFEVDEDTLHAAQGKGVPDHILNLKIGAVCLITRNLNIQEGLVNGTKVIIEAISPRLIRVRKPNLPQSYAIPRIMFKFPIIEGSPMDMTRRQFPLQIAYAMTFHKSQGQTIKMVGVDLRSNCFTHGQLYVGLSRVRSPADITVLVEPDRVLDGVAYTRNIIYKDLLHTME